MIKFKRYIILMCVFVSPIHAEIYKCPSLDGGVTFSQNICMDGFRKINGKWVNLAEERKEKTKKIKDREEMKTREADKKQKQHEEMQKKIELNIKYWNNNISKNTRLGKEGELIFRSMPERAKYYLISVESNENYLKTIHSRVSSMSHGYSVTNINCKNRRYQDLGYGEDKQSNIKMYNNIRWANIIKGSSKYDLVTFVCNSKNKIYTK